MGLSKFKQDIDVFCAFSTSLGSFGWLVLFMLSLKEKSITGVLKQFIKVWRK